MCIAAHNLSSCVPGKMFVYTKPTIESYVRNYGFSCPVDNRASQQAQEYICLSAKYSPPDGFCPGILDNEAVIEWR